MSQHFFFFYRDCFILFADRHVSPHTNGLLNKDYLSIHKGYLLINLPQASTLALGYSLDFHVFQ